MIDAETIKKAIYNPAHAFKRPKDVLREDLPLAQALSISQKIELLERWAYDVKEREVAESENMRSSNNYVDLLHEIMIILDQLKDSRP